MEEHPIRLRLEVEPRCEPIRGVFDDGRGDRRAFEGWMELAAVLQAFCDAGVTAGDADAEPG